ncbi:hypothetical protein NP493_371g01043 [Ridgeia piscesae]|uniref:Solute carrier family 12 member 6 n=1 Tax=Ridgeia piscesae TaxID=27915 RepID=A0AAD9L269_RIDPI|nr:hypothetical protein NP493_371g01043 [Ridgeia piscesae]
MFVRLAWMVGCLGLFKSLIIVAICCLTTFLTAISMSAIATNGKVQAGGSYFMISRNMGPESGGAVGVCFYLANTFAVDLYVLGAVEILLQYLYPDMAFFGDIHTNPWNNYRFYGSITVAALGVIVAIGVKFVQMFAPITLMSVIVAIGSIVIGSFLVNAQNTNIWLCMLGDSLLRYPYGSTQSIDVWCTKNSTGPLASRYCQTTNFTQVCADHFTNDNISIVVGIPGLQSGTFHNNFFSSETRSHRDDDVSYNADISFVALTAIYFPSVTGIMTGSNMSGDLRDPQKSIPMGTILAQLTCSFVYMLLTILYGATSNIRLLQDKYGESLGGSLLAAKLGWPNQWVVLIGAFCSTLGAALQCLTSAPRLLQAIAHDNVIPFLEYFKVKTRRNEPHRALLITMVIAESGILLANLDWVAPILDVFFLMCYGFVNLTCALQTLLQTPSWRPRFTYYHWSLSLLGVILNLGLSMTAGWYYAIAAFGIAAFIYKYVEYKGGEKEWGDGIRGLSMMTAHKALIRLNESEPHTKNWRPQMLILVKLCDDLTPIYPKLFTFASQLKAGKGLVIAATAIEGNFITDIEKFHQAREMLLEMMSSVGIEGFAQVNISNNIMCSLSGFVQTAGLGGMRHNTLVMEWPRSWDRNREGWINFVKTLRIAAVRDIAILVSRGIINFPSNEDRMTDTIDVWWIVHDGGMLILLSYLLTMHNVWSSCTIRVFTVAQMSDNSVQLRKDLKMFLYDLRIDAEVFVEEMNDQDISAYTVERTLDMQNRVKMLKILKGRTFSDKNRMSISKRASQEHLKEKDKDPTNGTERYQTLAVPEGEVWTSTSDSDGDQDKLKRMSTAVKLNEAIKNRSSKADLVIVNFPTPPEKYDLQHCYMEYLDVLSSGLPRVLMVRGSGMEVVTIYS